MDIDLEQLRELMRALEEFGVNELEIERDEQRIFLRRGTPPESAPVVAQPVAPTQQPQGTGNGASAPAAAASQEQQEPEEDENVVYVTSPFVGTFYRAPSPTDAPFVEVGQDVQVGQSLCIVEAMKLMNEIEAEFSGTIIEILAENGKPVEYGDRLFKMRKKG
jgi:acetyl-CoA carboxylase biotin carboxyl carrier protein